MPAILEFAKKHTHLDTKVSFTDRFTDMIEDRIDVAVRIGQVEAWPATLDHRHLGDEQLILCASPGYLRKKGKLKSEADLSKFDCVLYGKSDGSTATWRLPKGYEQLEKKMRSRIVLGSAEAQVAAVMAGYGVAQFATWLIEEELKRGDLTQILPHIVQRGLPLDLVWQRSLRLTPKVDLLIEFLAQHLRVSL